MVKRSLRSRSFRKIKVKVPGGDVKVHFRKKKPSKAHCAGCGAILSGVASYRQTVMRNIPKTKKRPERPFGGVLCSRCSRSAIKQKAKSLE